MDFFGPYGSRPISNCNQSISPCYKSLVSSNINCHPNYNTNCYCPPKDTCHYRHLTIPAFITSNIPIRQTTSYPFYTDIGLRTKYQPNNPVSYTIYNQGETSGQDTIPNNSKEIKIIIDIHTMVEEEFPPVNMTLKENSEITTISKSVIGSKETVFNVIISYLTKTITNETMSYCVLQTNQNLAFKIVSMSISYS